MFGGLLRDIEEGYAKQVAFVVPVGVAWPLPAYELALMTAWEARQHGPRDVSITIYTPESAPLQAFGPAAATAMREDLEEVARRVETDASVHADRARLVVEPGGRAAARPRRRAPARRRPALPGLAVRRPRLHPGRRHGKVYGTANVWAAGDVIAFPVKQGGLAAQQAVAAAAVDRGARRRRRTPRAVPPVLRGVLLTGRGQAWLRSADEGTEGEAERRALFWPPTKIAGRYLSPYLAGEPATAPPGQLVDLDLR